MPEIEKGFRLSPNQHVRHPSAYTGFNRFFAEKAKVSVRSADIYCERQYHRSTSKLIKGHMQSFNMSVPEILSGEWQPYLLNPERPYDISTFQFGVTMLSHAVAYLVEEQLSGRRTPVQANREAIDILCQAGEEVAYAERRKPESRLLAAWLRRAHRNLVVAPFRSM